MDEPKIKGGVIREFFAWYQDEVGVEKVRSLLPRVPEDMRALLDPDEPFLKILPASWYPSRLVCVMLDAISEGMTDAQIRKLAHDANRAVIRRDVGSVYRFLLDKLATPEMYALAVPRFWRQLHTTGVRKMRVLGDREAESVVSQWPGHHPLLCTITIETMCSVFELMGKKDVKWKRTACVSAGASECVTLLSWR
jgi:hypothetical protein